MNKRSIWVWYSDAPQGGYLFHGNLNAKCPPYHLGGVDNMLYGEHIVWAATRKTLEMELGILAWNEWFPKLRVKPVSIMVEFRPYYKRAKKEGGVK